MTGLEQLATIKGLEIGGCSALENLGGLENLEYVTGQFKLQGNGSLISIGELTGIQSIETVLITDNRVLDQCQAFLQVQGWNVQDTVLVGDNGPCE